MIEHSQYIYYLSYIGLCLILMISYVKIKSTEGLTITTKEFKVFQSNFLIGYSSLILCELIAAASFYHTFISLHLNLDQITRLYIITIVSSTITGVIIEIIDLGSKKEKCILSAILYSISMFSIFFGGHYEMLLIGRIVYGAASALHHTSFEAYIIHEHSSLGFPEDWLSQTFSLLTHLMALMAAACGVVGQIAAFSAKLGCIGFCCTMFALTAVFIFFSWEKDMNSPRFMLSGFLFNANQVLQSMRTNKQIFILLLISSLCECSITIFTFYWAPWISIIIAEEDLQIPYEIYFSVLIVASMLGNYMFQLYGSVFGPIENTFQLLLLGSTASYFLGAIFQTPAMAFGISIIVQLCMGGYWPSVGYFRGKLINPQFRNTALIFPKVVTMFLTLLILGSIHHSPMMILGSCAVLNGVAAYLQFIYLDSKSLEDDEDSDDDDIGDF